MKKLLVLPMLVFSSLSIGGTVDDVGRIGLIRAVSSVHADAGELTAIFKLIPAQSSCTWIKLAPGSDSYTSMLLFARAQDMEVRVWFDDVSCQANTIELR